MLGKNRKRKWDSKIFLPTITNLDFLWGILPVSAFICTFAEQKLI